MLADDITTAFAQRLDEVFHRQGFQGEIRQIALLDQPARALPLLTINLTEWRVDLVGNITCTFTGNVQTGETKRSLGIFTESAFRWMSGPGRFGLADSLGQAAEGAIRQLYDKLARSGQLTPAEGR